MRSVELHSFYIVYASVTERNGGRLFSRDPANARDVGGFTLVAPPSGVDALEKARRDPLKWGLSHNSAIQGEVPPRPQRVPPPLHPEAISSNSSIVCSVPPPSQQAYGSPLTQDMIMKTQSMLQNVLQTQASMTQASILQAAQTRQARLLLA